MSEVVLDFDGLYASVREGLDEAAPEGPAPDVALITGITGQDGSHMADLLLEAGYRVCGIIRRQRDAAAMNQNIQHIIDRVSLFEGDITDAGFIHGIVQALQPGEIYHYAAQSFVPTSFRAPAHTTDVNVLGTLHLLEAVRNSRAESRFFFAGSSEQFGNVPGPQDEDTPMHPVSPYGVSKLAAYHLVRNYRQAYGMYACSGISFNHEGPRRGPLFVTRKIAAAVARRSRLSLGNLQAKRDWGYAPDYVRGHWQMMQQPVPEDFVFATGETHSVLEFVEVAYGVAGLDWRKFVQAGKTAHTRPNELHELRGVASRALHRFGWRPKTTFKDLVRLMVEAEQEAAKS